MLRTWKLALLPAQSGDDSLHLRIVQSVIEEIRRGRLEPGMALPGTRVLAGDLGVNRKTVVLAYEELEAQGWLETQEKRGTFVSRRLPKPDAGSADEAAYAGFASSAGSEGEDLLRATLPLAGAAGTGRIVITDGVPDTRLIPFDLLSRAYRHALVASARANRLGYGDPRGEPALRAAIAAMLRLERGLNVREENICVVRGSQMGIYLAARLLTRPGDRVAFETLSYPPARAAFRSCGATVLDIEQDEHGLIPEALERVCQATQLKAVFTTPHHQFPTTVTMPADRRLKLLALARKHGFVVVEDDYDHEFHFSSNPVFPLASMTGTGHVLLIGSLSKVLAPGLRLGYIVASAGFVAQCAAEIMLIDRQGNALTEIAVTELMESGELKRHIRRALKIYEQRRDLCASLVRGELGADASFQVPIGGLALWLHLHEGIGIRRFTEAASAEGVDCLPGSVYLNGPGNVEGFRLGYGNLDEAELGTAIRRLGAALRKCRG